MRVVIVQDSLMTVETVFIVRVILMGPTVRWPGGTYYNRPLFPTSDGV